MADLVRDAAPLRFRNDQHRIEEWTLDNSAAQTVFRGQPMILDKSADTKYARAWLAATTLVTATDVFLGIAMEGKVVMTTDVETNNVIEVVTYGEVGIKTSVFTDADVGKTISFTDSATLAAAAESASQLAIGKLNAVEDGYAYIQLNTPKIMSF